MSPLGVNALHALELHALVGPLGLVVQRSGGPILVPSGVQTPHDVPRDRQRSPLHAMGGPVSFHPQEVQLEVGRHAPTQIQVRAEV